MKIGIDAHAAERDGTGNCTYIRGLLKGLTQIDRKNEYILYVTDLNHPFYDNFHCVENFQIRLLKPKTPVIRTSLSLAKRSFSDKLDLLHVQYFAPPAHKGLLIITIHDLAFIHFPESFDRIERFRLKILVPTNARKAKKVICGSNFSKNDIAQQCKIDPARIEVTHYGVPSYFKPVETSIRERETVLSSYGIKDKFIFSLGRINYRKNLNTLIEAYKHLRIRKKINLKLVIGGKRDFLFSEILKEIKSSGYENDILLPGYIDEMDLPTLFSSAELFVYPSLFEGFGLPPLEAMACGCPVIASNVSSIPEVVGDAGILIDPNNVDQVSKAIHKLISDVGFKEIMINKGLERAKLFNWDKTARKTLKLYEEVFEDCA